MTLCQASAGQPRHHLHRRPGAGREPRVSGKGGAVGRRQVVFPERPCRPGADPAARRGGAHRHDRGGEDRSQPKVVKQAEILDGVGMESAPPLRGYVRFQTRPTSDDHPAGRPRRSAAGALAVRPGPRGGLHLRRQEPLGRELGDVARVRQAVDQHLPRSAAARSAERDRPPISTARPSELVVDYRLSKQRADEPAASSRYLRLRSERLPGAAEGGQGGRGPLSRAPGRSAQSQGLFRVRPLADSRAFPEVGFYRQEDEMREYGNNEALLRQIAACDRRPFPAVGAADVRCGRPQHPRRDATLAGRCWRWRFC